MMEKVQRVRTSTQVHTRKLDRSVAHRNMERAGLKRVNKHDHVGTGWMIERIDSYFAKHWRETISVPTIDLRKKRRKSR